MHQRFAVFAHGRFAHPAAKQLRHQLRAIAQAQNGNAQFKNFGAHRRSVWRINAAPAAGKDHALGPLCFYGLQRL